jgi:hypothetical protein
LSTLVVVECCQVRQLERKEDIRGCPAISTLFYGPSSAPSKRAEYSFTGTAIEAVWQCLNGHADYADIAPLVIQAVGEAIERLAEREHDPARIKQFRLIRPHKSRKEKK